MANIPSRFRTEKTRGLATTLGLLDPFRMLHPIKQESTYVPNVRVNLNRSRIDYFLVSENFSGSVKKANISPSLSSTAFDHKKVKICLGKTISAKNFNKLNYKILKEEVICILIKSKILESYVIHADPYTVPGFVRNNILIDIGRIERMVRQILESKYDFDPLLPVRDDDSDELLEQAMDIFETLPDIEFFENITLSCADDYFFEVL
jgi:hypothetical protein